ncbi:unnamed protein product [Orchesella dallaii]|uniref:Uncharacterized protein n=1 Tax=Orchesella dallaii TaxID=48710 RepID=A0ABP1PXX3_9HEXA
MDRAKEFLKSLKNGAPSGACGTIGTGHGSAVDWKQEYDNLRNEVEIYKRWVQSETAAELAGVELRWSQLQKEAETMKRTLESENRDLSRQKTSLERQVTALREELEETRLISHEQIKHATTMKRQLQETCTTLELKWKKKRRSYQH